MKTAVQLVLLLMLGQIASAQKIELPVDTIVKTVHTTLIKGKKINYEAHTGTQPVWDKEGTPIASLFFTYYRRTNGDTVANRPLVFSFNGGPGSASVWMHLAYTGPRILKITMKVTLSNPMAIKAIPILFLMSQTLFLSTL